MMRGESWTKEKEEMLGTLKTGEIVFDRPHSHLHRNEALTTYLPLALERIDPEGRDFIVETVNFGETIGQSNCVETSAGDEIVYAQRLGKAGLTRFVKNRAKVPTSEVTVILKKVPQGYITITAFLGPKAEKEPWDRMATPASQTFWNSHAIVWGSEEIVQGSESGNGESPN